MWFNSCLTMYRAHEWLKHGTCSGMKMHQYFAEVLSLFNNKLDYNAILDKSGIVPSLTKTYHVCLFTLLISSSSCIVHLLYTQTSIGLRPPRFFYIERHCRMSGPGYTITQLYYQYARGANTNFIDLITVFKCTV